MADQSVLPPSLAPRGLCRALAAAYIGVSPSLFDRMVDDGRMPHAKRIDGRRVWDRTALDISFDELPTNGPDGAQPEKGEVNPWD